MNKRAKKLSEETLASLQKKQVALDRASDAYKASQTTWTSRAKSMEKSLYGLFHVQLLKRQRGLKNLISKFYGNDLSDPRAVALMGGSASSGFDHHWNSDMDKKEWKHEVMGSVYKNDYSWINEEHLYPHIYQGVTEDSVILKLDNGKTYLIPFAFFEMNENETVQFFRKRYNFFREFFEKPQARLREEKKIKAKISEKRQMMEALKIEIRNLEATMNPSK